MRVFIAALVTETNTFSPLPTGWAAFEEQGLSKHGEELLSTFLNEPLLRWKRRAEADRHEVIHSVSAYAEPAGRTAQRVYEALRDEILDDLRRLGPFDLCLLNLHGAMVSEACDDCEGDLLSKLRGVIGPKPVIGVELDCHAHLSDVMVENSDIIVAYREYPHIDIGETADRLYDVSIATLEGRIHPRPFVFDMQMVSYFFTQLPSMRSIINRMEEIECEGAVSVSFIHGFPWGDTADNGAKVLVYSNTELEAGATWAKDLATQIWLARECTFESGWPLEVALTELDQRPEGLVVLADMADNPGAGAPGDATFGLAAILRKPYGPVVVGPVWDPVAANICNEAGVGAELYLRVGGKTPSSGHPLDLPVRVRAVCAALSINALGGAVEYGLSVSVDVLSSDTSIVLTTNRMQALSPEMFTNLQLPLEDKRAAMVKSTNHFYAAFAPLATSVIRISGPGSVSTDFQKIPYLKRSQDYWPRVAKPSIWESR